MYYKKIKNHVYLNLINVQITYVLKKYLTYLFLRRTNEVNFLILRLLM